MTDSDVRGPSPPDASWVYEMMMQDLPLQTIISVCPGLIPCVYHWFYNRGCDLLGCSWKLNTVCVMERYGLRVLTLHIYINAIHLYTVDLSCVPLVLQLYETNHSGWKNSFHFHLTSSHVLNYLWKGLWTLTAVCITQLYMEEFLHHSATSTVSQWTDYRGNLFKNLKTGCGDNYSFSQISCCSECITISPRRWWYGNTFTANEANFMSPLLASTNEGVTAALTLPPPVFTMIVHHFFRFQQLAQRYYNFNIIIILLV